MKSETALEGEIARPDAGRSRAVRLTRFRSPHRRYIAALTSASSRLEDLAESFPALLFALATGYGNSEERERCFHLIEDGAPLKDASEALGLPYWLRRLPAQAFLAPIPRLPDGDAVAKTVVNVVPPTPAEAGHWLARVGFANEVAGPDYALWLARQSRFPFRRTIDTHFALLAAWAWYSARPDTFAGSLIRQPFEGRMGIKRAYDEARAWLRRLHLAVALGDGLSNTWFRDGAFNGYEFVALRTLDDFLDEASHMGNCLDQYAAPMRTGAVRVFSVRKAGERIANIEIKPHDDDCAMPVIEQVRGPCNARVAPKVWQAIYGWLGAQTLEPIRTEVSHVGAARVSQKIWSPILTALSGSEAQARIEDLIADVRRMKSFATPAR